MTSDQLQPIPKEANVSLCVQVRRWRSSKHELAKVGDPKAFLWGVQPTIAGARHGTNRSARDHRSTLFLDITGSFRSWNVVISHVLCFGVELSGDW